MDHVAPLTYVCRPNVQFYCDLDYDPFLLMKDQNKVYGISFFSLTYSTNSFPFHSTGFTISLYEYASTIPTLWETTKGEIDYCLPYYPNMASLAFIKEHPQYLSEDNAMAFLSSDGGESYNLCHCRLLRLRFSPCSCTAL